MTTTRPRAHARGALVLAPGLALLLASTALTPAFAQTAPPTPAPEAQPAPETAPTAAQPAQPAPAQPAPAQAAPAQPAPVLPAAAQANPQTSAPALAAPGTSGPVVGRIIVRGNERIETGTVLSYLPIQVGQQASPERLDLAIDTLARTGLFADVRLDVAGQDLIVQVIENPIINQVVFEGNGSLGEDKLREEVTVRPRGIFTRARVQQDVQRIVELYRSSGRIGATVTPKVVELPQRRVDLIFEINEGPQTGIGRVNFLGNSEFSDRELRGVVSTEESRWYRFFSSNDVFDPDRLEYDREQLREHYTNRGYYDFRVVSSIAELTPEQDAFRVTFTLDEGEEYRFGDVRVETQLQRLDPALLQALVPIRTGTVYKAEQIEQAVDALTFAAGAAGFANVDIRPREVPNRETNTVDVVFNVREGERVYVERIDIIGNTATLDQVIRRELRLVEGDPYNRVLVDRSRIDVRRLGFFEDVTIEELPGSAPDRNVLQVQVEEQATGELSFAAGYSSIDGLLIDLGVAQRNFRGRGQDLRVRMSLGSIRQIIDFSFTEPRFMGRNLSAGIDAYSTRYDLSEQAAFEQTRTGAGIRFGFLSSAQSRLLTRYQVISDDIRVDQGACAAQLIDQLLCEQSGQAFTSLAGYTFIWDRRNDPRRPTRGFDLTFRQDLAGLGGDVNYVRTEVEGSWHYGFRPEWVLSASAQAGYIEGWNGDFIRVNDLFYKGGNSFRGFEVAGIGPRSLQTDRARGGKAYAIASLEFSFPTPLPEQYGIGTALFLDVGTLGLLDEAVTANQPCNVAARTGICDDLALRATAGLSVFWDSPLGPIRFDFSQVLAKEPYDKTETFRFSQTTRF